MYTELINATDYTNVYGLYDENERLIGTKEITLAGRNVGTRYSSWCSMTRKEIRAIFASLT